MKKIWKTLKARISVMAGRIQLKIGMECVLPQETFHSKIVQFCLGIIELQMRVFLVSI